MRRGNSRVPSAGMPEYCLVRATSAADAARMIHSARPRLSRRSWQAILPLALFLALAAGWTVLWFHASSVAQAAIAAWREREAELGRVYTCASEDLGGYPFRIE